MDSKNPELPTVLQLANELNTTPQEILDHLRASGITKATETERITHEEQIIIKDRLLPPSHQTQPRKIKLERKTTSTLRIAGSKSISVEVRKKKVYIQRAPHETKEEPLTEAAKIISFSNDRGDDSAKADRWIKPTSIEVENFKAIKKLNLPLADVTILVGPNGSGKSSILQAVHWAARAASYIEPKKQSEVVSFDRLDYAPSSEPLKTAHKAELSSARETPPTIVSFITSNETDENPTIASVKIWAARNKSGISAHIEGGSAVTPFKQRTELITAYIPGLAGLSEKETILVQPLLRRQAASGDAGGVLRNILFNLWNRQPGEIDDISATMRKESLDRFIQMIHPGVSVKVTFDEREDFHINVTFDDERLKGESRPLESAATGILQVIQIFAYLVLFRPKLLLIDEPDAHLHPDKQEKLIEALELAAREFNTQAIITTHSPHIVRGASHTSKILWVRDGQIVSEDDNLIKNLLGWGGLNKKILFFVEDENADPIKAILKQWPELEKNIAICRCFGVDNLPRNPLLKGLIGDNNLNIKVLIHRDRDFMTEEDTLLWGKRYSTPGVYTWITDHVDAEAYFCQPEYISNLYNISLELSSEIVRLAVSDCKNTKKIFFEKRKLINRSLYEDGGSENSEKLWNLLNKESIETTVGKTLHRTLKQHLKNNGLDEKEINRFATPQNHAIAISLKNKIEEILTSF